MIIEDTNNLFKQALSSLEQEIKNSESEIAHNNFLTTFANIIDVYKFENNFIYITVSDYMLKFKVEKFYSSRLNDILHNLTNENIRVKFITTEEKEEDEKKINPSITPEVIDINKTKRRLRAEFTFDNFVVGESNRFAYSEARQVANSPYALFNPLYIMGDVGLGKTHLMMAIGHYILDNNPNANVIYTSTQQFADDYFRATSRKDREEMIKFADYYRGADVLLVDDIQFLEGKQATQEEFFKYFDYLHEHNKQIIVTSDRVATDLKLMARLKSRFTWGVVVEVKTPDLSLRINILRRKLAFLIQNPKDVPDDVLEAIANSFTNNVRELEGALRTYVNFCVSFSLPFTLENINEALGKSITTSDNVVKSKDIDNLKSIIASYFQISVEDLVSDSRKSQIVYARNISFYILREEFKTPLKKIGDYFGNRDHATVAHGYDKIKSVIETNQQIKNDVNYVIKKMSK